MAFGDVIPHVAVSDTLLETPTQKATTMHILPKDQLLPHYITGKMGPSPLLVFKPRKSLSSHLCLKEWNILGRYIMTWPSRAILSLLSEHHCYPKAKRDEEELDCSSVTQVSPKKLSKKESTEDIDMKASFASFTCSEWKLKVINLVGKDIQT